jgi:prepilin-type N-terminal cleavage/methylation domain-containing protein
MKKGFTLAEVLITLAVIGVVAALTIPTVVQNYRKTQTVTQLKKVYSALANTTNLAIADYGPITQWEIGEMSNSEDAEKFANMYLIPYLKVSKNCGTKTTEDCEIRRKYLNSTGTAPTVSSAYTRFFLADGTLVFGRVYSDETLKRFITWVDINGEKAPNTMGKDIFEFNYFLYFPSDTKYEGRFIPIGITLSRNDLLNNGSNSCNKQDGSGAYCAALIMKDGWQISDDYPWN